MEAQYAKRAGAIDYTPTVDVAGGTVVVLNDRVGITIRPIAANDLGAVHTDGVFDVLTKPTGTAYAIGERVYWNEAASEPRKTATGNVFMGFAFSDAASDATVLRVELASD